MANEKTNFNTHWSKNDLGLISLENYKQMGMKKEVDRVFDKGGHGSFSKSMSPKQPIKSN